jgi:hypothetical protein
MQPLRVFLDKDQLIETLNIPPPNRDARERIVLRYVQKSGEVSRDEADSLWRTEVSRWLRHHVDEWLSTGLNPDGSESPSNRDMFRTTNAVWAALRYVKEHPARVSFSPSSPGPELIIGEPHSLSENWNEFFLDAVKEADRHFTSLMASDWKESLCQCRFARCSRYFLASRLRRSYRHGTFCCREHQNLGSAAACVSVRRAQIENELIDLAARQLLRWGLDGPRWQNDANRKHRLASDLSMYISRRTLQSYRQNVAVRWVTRHQLEIERRRTNLSALRLGTIGVNDQTAGEEGLQHPTRALRWIPRLTPDQMHFIQVLSISDSGDGER